MLTIVDGMAFARLRAVSVPAIYQIESFTNMIWFASNMKSVSLSVVLLTFLVGCGGSGGDGYSGPRGQVSGTVKHQGKPVPEGSTVLFQAKEGSTFAATGAVKAEGKFELVYQGTPEMPAVEYLVQVSQPPVAAPTGAVDPAMMDGKKLLDASKAATHPFPLKYSSVRTSNLTYTVKAGANTADLVLAE